MESSDNQQICRTCMAEAKQNQTLHFLYDPATRNSTQSVADLLLSTIPRLYIQLEDELPKNICIHCLDTLVKLADFQRMCLQSQRKLFQLMCTGEVAQSSNTAASITEITPQTDPLAFEIKVFEDLDVLQNNDHLLKEVEDEDIIGEESSRDTGEKDAKGNHKKPPRRCKTNEGLDVPIEISPLGPTQNLSGPDILDRALVHIGSTATNQVSYEDHDTDINPTEQTGETLKGSKYVCEHCNKEIAFKFLKGLREHLRIHSRIKSYKCLDCPETFAGLHELYSHKKVHMKDKGHTCDVCGTLFLKKYHLKQHSIIHKGQRSFKCEYCDKRFLFDYDVRKHQRIHTGEKPYNCKYCDRTFLYSGQRNKHLRTHLGENIYMCKLCPQKFRLAIELREHMTLHNNQDEDTVQSNDEVAQSSNTAASITEIIPQTDPVAFEIQVFENVDLLQNKGHLFKEVEDEDMIGEKSSRDVVGEDSKGYHKKPPKRCKTEEELDVPIEISPLVPTQNLNGPEILDSTGVYTGLNATNQAIHKDQDTDISPTGKTEITLRKGSKYVCEHCNKAFNFSKRLREHLSVHTDERPYKCTDCGKKFKTSSHLRKHLHSHTRIKSYKCLDCSETFANLRELYSHKKVHMKDKGHTCDVCGTVFLRQSQLKQHSMIHKGQRSFKCEYCDKRFLFNYDVRKHQRIHTGEKPYNCKYCDCTFRYSNERNKHLRTHLGENIYICKLCPQKFRLAIELREHMTLHNNHDEDTVQSNDEMDEAMNSESERSVGTGELKEIKRSDINVAESDILENEEGLKPINADISKKIHKTRGKTQSTDKGTNDLVCDYCNEVFQKRSALQVHMRIHTGDNPCLCSECGKVFKNHRALKQHLLRHRIEKNFECPECPKKFICNSDLHSHKMHHTKIKRHVCDLCGTAFGTRTLLKTHRMRHTGEKPHECGYCEKRFVVAEHLRRHQRTHTGEKPYKCQYCTMAYAQSNDLIKHLRTHLGENVYKCELCPQRFRMAREVREHFPSHKNEDEATRLKNLHALQEEEAKLKATMTKSGNA